jgi:hypothetical protein
LISLAPNVLMGPPYWFGMLAFDEVLVQHLQFGADCILDGGAPSSFWDCRRPAELVPIAARILDVGMRFSVQLHNGSCASMWTAVMLWGTPVKPADQIAGRTEPFDRFAPRFEPDDRTYDAKAKDFFPRPGYWK